MYRYLTSALCLTPVSFQYKLRHWQLHIEWFLLLLPRYLITYLYPGVVCTWTARKPYGCYIYTMRIKLNEPCIDTLQSWAYRRLVHPRGITKGFSLIGCRNYTGTRCNCTSWIANLLAYTRLSSFVTWLLGGANINWSVWNPLAHLLASSVRRFGRLLQPGFTCALLFHWCTNESIYGIWKAVF